jgi:hypothetical protein
MMDTQQDRDITRTIESFERAYKAALPCEQYVDAAGEFGRWLEGYCGNCCWTWDSHGSEE